MAVSTGTASGHGDLMRKLRTFLLANDWDEMRWVPVGPLGGQPYLGSSQDGCKRAGQCIRWRCQRQRGLADVLGPGDSILDSGPLR